MAKPYNKIRTFSSFLNDIQLNFVLRVSFSHDGLCTIVVKKFFLLDIHIASAFSKERMYCITSFQEEVLTACQSVKSRCL